MGWLGQVERDGRAVEALEAFSAQLAKQVLLVRGDVVDQFLVERFLFGERLGFAYGAFGEFDVAAALGNDGTHQGGGVVLDFFHHGLVGLAEESHGMGGAGVGAGSHGGDIGGFENEDSGRGGAAPVGAT